MTYENPELQTEKHFAIVTRNVDDRLGPAGRGLVFFKSDTLSGDAEFGEPAQPSFPLAGQNQEGFFWVPQVGDQIEVEINRADEHMVPRYTRMLYSSEDDIPEEFKVNYPNRMGWRTRKGHLLLFDNSTPQGGEDEGLDRLLVMFFHAIGTGFIWRKNGDEIKTIVRDLVETIQRNLVRTVTGTVTEDLKAEVTRTITGKLTETIKNDVVRKVQGNLTQDVSGNISDKAGGNTSQNSGGNHNIVAGGNVDVMGAQILLNGSASGVTTENSHMGVIDLITGVPVSPSTTVFADI